jgi:hypothetical protein
MVFYVILPSVVMLICSCIIIVRIFSANRRLRNNAHLSKKRYNKNKQISYLLLSTNFLFFTMVSPLLVANSLSVLEDSNYMITSTLVYLLAYANHGYHIFNLKSEIHKNLDFT